jgi:glycosyltransferase involved in cell wall biosynthesis
MRVVLAAPDMYPARGGVELHVFNIARGLASVGHEVTVLLQNGPARTNELEKITVHHGVSKIGLWSHIRRSEPDAVHAHGARSMFAVIALLAGRISGATTIFTPHCFYPAQDVKGRLKRLLFDPTFGRAAFEATHRLIALTSQDRQDAIDLGADAKRIFVVPNSIRLSQAQSMPEAHQAKCQESLGTYLLSVGRIDRVKRGDFLIAALSHLPEHVNMVFAGPDAGHQKHCEQLAEQLGVQHRVRFLGEISDAELKTAYSGAAAVVMASRYEGLPTVLLEAMAFRIPVIAANSGGIRFLVRDRETGYLYEYDDLQGYTDAVRCVISMPQGEIIERARALVANEYSWEANLPRIVALYDGHEQITQRLAAQTK